MNDTLFLHPRILLAPTATARCEAMLVSNGRIVALGSETELSDAAPIGARRVRLPGAAVVPGFHDAHTHIGSLARELDSPDLRAARSLAAVGAALRTWNAEHPGSGWIVGGRWDRNLWPMGEMPTRQLLDTIFSDRPVALPSIDGHSLWANTAGLVAAGFTADTPDPSGGRIVREKDGRTPTGLLLETAGDIVRDLAEATVSAGMHARLGRAQQHLLERGITHITNFEEADVRVGLERLRAEGELAFRSHLGIAVDELDEAIAAGVRTGDGDDWITTGAVKLYADGALGSHTAHLSEPFDGEPGNRGIEVTDLEQLSALIARAVGAGIAVATHAIGDRANSLVLDAYEPHAAASAAAGLINRIEHAQHLLWRDVPRFARLGVVASLQPTHCTSDFRLGEELLGRRDLAHYAWRSLIDSGALVAFGSDAPIEPIDPMLGIHAAVTRQDPAGDPPGGREPEQRITVLEALRCFSETPARAAGLEHRVGRLAPGMLADFVALDRDPLTVSHNEIPHLAVRATVVHGEVRHRTD